MRLLAPRLVLVSVIAATVVSACDTGSGTREPAASLPAGFTWAGGEEHGFWLAVPEEWVEFEPESEDLAARHGVVFLDPAGARDFDDYEVHLIASCGGDQGIKTTDHLETATPSVLRDYDNVAIRRVAAGEVELVRSEYDSESTSGEPEHWYAYYFLATGDRLCSITLTTPLVAGERIRLTEIFDAIGQTVEPLDSPDAG